MLSTVPLIPIMLDKPRHLRLDNRALFRCERELSTLWNCKTSLLTVFIDLANLSLNDLAIMLWVGLLHEDPTLTLEQTQDLMELSKLPDILGAILKAWNAATLPAEIQTVGKGEDGPLALSGHNSGPTAALSLA
jgi:hypothetical protein